MATGTIKSNRATGLTVTASGNFSTTQIIARRDQAFVYIGGYFANTANAVGDVATISGIHIYNANNLAVPCQCDDGSVRFVSFENRGANAVVKIGMTLTANKYVRFGSTFPIE